MSDERTAGRELDAMVAERVLGYEWRRGTRRGEPPIKWLLSPEQREYFTFGNDAPQGDERVAGDYDRHVPRLSTDIAAAFLVVEKMRERGAYLMLENTRPFNGPEHWQVYFQSVTTLGEARADTAPRAICLAALQDAALLAASPEGQPHG